METTLHRQLKQQYAAQPDQVEVTMGAFRIDALGADGELIEIQHAGLGSIRDKIRKLLENYHVRVVKPIVIRRRLVRLADLDGPIVSRRLSPKKGSILDLFTEMIHFSNVFPHPRLTLEVPLVEIEEWRYATGVKHRRWNRERLKVIDQNLQAVIETQQFRTTDDLWNLLGVDDLPEIFHTGQLAAAVQKPRWFAQQTAYVLSHCGAIECVGKQGNSRLYQRVFPVKADMKSLPTKKRRRKAV